MRGFGILAPAFEQRDEAIGGAAGKRFSITIGPANFNAAYHCAASKSEVQAHIVIGDVAGATANLLLVFVIIRNNHDLGADTIPIRLRSAGDHAEPMILASRFIHKKHRLVVHIVHRDGQATVIPEIGDGETAA